MNEERAMVPVDDLTFVVSIEEAKRKVKALQEFVREVMIKGEDYGEIPGVAKPTLLKPGAEKLCEIYGFAISPRTVSRIEDWEKGLFHYEVHVDLVNKRTGQLVATGVGSANSREKRYVAGKQQDPYTMVNTVLKMAKKRALIDAVLSATRSSGVFTQDVEDIVEGEIVTPPPKSPEPHEAGEEESPKKEDLASENQRKAIFAICSKVKIDPGEFLQSKNFPSHVNELSKRQASQVIEELKAFEKEVDMATPK